MCVGRERRKKKGREGHTKNCMSSEITRLLWQQMVKATGQERGQVRLEQLWEHIHLHTHTHTHTHTAESEL